MRWHRLEAGSDTSGRGSDAALRKPGSREGGDAATRYGVIRTDSHVLGQESAKMATWIGGIYIGPRTPSSCCFILFPPSSYAALPILRPWKTRRRRKETYHPPVAYHISDITARTSDGDSHLASPTRVTEHQHDVLWHVLRALPRGDGAVGVLPLRPRERHLVWPVMAGGSDTRG